MKKRLYKNFFWLIVLCVVGVIFFPGFSRIQKLKTRDKVLSQKIIALEQENERLCQENEMLKTDPLFIEEVAREKLKVAKENEIIFRVVGAEEE